MKTETVDITQRTLRVSHSRTVTPENLDFMEKPETQSAVGSTRLVDDWREAQRLFRKAADQTPARMITGGGWDRCARMWQDFDRIIEHMEKSANSKINE